MSPRILLRSSWATTTRCFSTGHPIVCLFDRHSSQNNRRDTCSGSLVTRPKWQVTLASFFSTSAPLFSSSGNKRESNFSDEDESASSSVLTLNKSKRLMRLIYARVHPDLFTNALHAQKENENSLKKLRNLIDSYSSLYSSDPYASLTNSSHSTTNHDLTFYIRETEDRKKLKKISIKNESLSISKSSRRSHSVQNRLENVFNQLIDELKIPMKKFKPSDNSTHTSTRPLNFRFDFRRGYDDDYVDFEDFEKWSRMKEKETRVPHLKEWLETNKTRIDEKQREAANIKEQLNENKSQLIKKWKLNNIIIKTNWSLKSFNSYLLALNNFTPLSGAHFEGFTLVLTNSNVPGLRKSGHIHLNCGQVYEEWLDILAVSKKNAKLLEEIKQMEDYISRLLKQIKICDPLENNTNNESLISLASFYHGHLNMILNNMTTSLGSIDDMGKLMNDSKFANLQLTIQNVSTIKMNQAGQFIIGASNRISFHNTLEFIKNNRDRSLTLYNKYLTSHETLRRLQENLETVLSTNITFESGLDMEQKISALENLKNVVTGAQNQEAQQQLSDLVKNSSLNMASYYKVNDDGSVDIPWNFKWSVS